MDVLNECSLRRKTLICSVDFRNQGTNTLLHTRACFKKNLSLHIFAETFLNDLFYDFTTKFHFLLSKNSHDLFLVIDLSSVVNPQISPPAHQPPLYTYRHTLFPFSTPYFLLFIKINTVILLLTSSLHKQPFITAHFRSSLHILFITAC